MKRIFIGSFIISEMLKKRYPLIKKEFGGFLKGRWSPFENLHITYKFIGDTTDQQVILIKESLKKVLDIDTEVNIVFKGFGVFPNIKSPKVFYIKVEDKNGKLEEIYSYVQEKLSLIGYEKDIKPFIPHITLKRPKYVNTEDFLSKMKRFENEIFGKQEKIQVNVIQSILSPKGAKYIKI